MSKHPSGLFKFDFDPTSDLRRVCISACLWGEDSCAKATRISLTSLTRKLHGQTKISLTWPEALMLRDCLKLHREERMAPESALMNDVLLLEGAISDRDETVLRDLENEKKTSWVRIRLGLTEAEKEERSYREKRDAIFREMVGNPAKLNIWGFEEKEEAPVEEPPKCDLYDLTSFNGTDSSTSVSVSPSGTTSVKVNITISPEVASSTNLYVADSHPENNPFNITVGDSSNSGFTSLRHQAKPILFPMQPEFSTKAAGQRFVVSDTSGELLSQEEAEMVLSTPMVQYLLRDAGVDKG